MKNDPNKEKISKDTIQIPKGKEVKYSVVDGLAILEGDIILGPVEKVGNITLESLGDIITDEKFRWPDGIVPYIIDPSLPNQVRVTKAISHWEEKTFIRFVERTTEANYIRFISGSGCGSAIGMRSTGQQDILLADDCDRGQVIHEIGHAIGLYHEQCREDRDDYVDIHQENIETGKEHNFDKHIALSDDYGSYDYQSIMHYGMYDFAIDKTKPTIEPKNKEDKGIYIGQRNSLSNGDVSSVYRMYNRPSWPKDEKDIKVIPGWFGGENQGGDVAIYDINSNGKSDLIVFHIDNPEGANRGYYRIGWDLDTNGNPSHWDKEVKEIPFWFGGENQDGGIAITDLNGNGRPDLIVFHIDNPDGGNRGYYRIGRDLDINGYTPNWSEPIPVPNPYDGFSWENQGCGITITDLNNNGKPDLIVFYIDNPEGRNRGYYRIGWDLDNTGLAVNGWSEPIPIPYWFGGENQGGGITIANLNGNGRPDLIVFHIDNPEGGNRGYYRVGWDLDINGYTPNWSEPIPIPLWFGGENQGGGIAATDLNGNGKPDLIVFHIDNPEGANTGYYRIGKDAR